MVGDIAKKLIPQRFHEIVGLICLAFTLFW